MGKISDLFKKIRDMGGSISYKDGHNKGQKWYGPTRSRRNSEEVEAYKELYKKGLNDLDNHDGVITHLESDF